MSSMRLMHRWWPPVLMMAAIRNQLEFLAAVTTPVAMEITWIGVFPNSVSCSLADYRASDCADCCCSECKYSSSDIHETPSYVVFYGGLSVV